MPHSPDGRNRLTRGCRSFTLDEVRTPRPAAVVFGTLIGAMLGFALPARAQGAPIEDVMLAEVGPGWALVEEGFGGGWTVHAHVPERSRQPRSSPASPSRRHPASARCSRCSRTATGFDSVPEASLELAAWLVPNGSQLDSDTFGWLAFASRDHFFSATVQTDGTGACRRRWRSSASWRSGKSRRPAAHPRPRIRQRQR